jgi:hypothetical protein
VCGSQPEIKDGSDKEKKQEETKQRKIDPELLDELIKQYEKPEQAAGPGGLLEQLTKRVYERILGGEMSHYLGYAKGQAPKLEAGQERNNYRNGSSKKTLINEEGQELEIEIPRDRAGEFEPQFIPKGQKRFGGFDTKIIVPQSGICARNECKGDPAISGRAVSSRSLQRSDQCNDRFGDGGCGGMAKPTVGADVSGGVF